MEIWKQVPGYKFYEASSIGNVKSKNRFFIKTNGVGQTIKTRILKTYTSKQGYKLVTLCSPKKKPKTFPVHKIIAKTFIPNPLNKPEINHKDGIKINNGAINLEWCTASENRKHAFDLGIQIPVKGEQHGASKLTEEAVFFIRGYKYLYTFKELGSMFGVTPPAVRLVYIKKTWKHI